MSDLLSGIDSAMSRRNSRMRQSQSAYPPTLSPQQQTSILGHVGSGTISGLGAIGNVLDLPGSMIRDTLGGENPFDQLLPWNWMTHENRLTGRDMLRKWGAVAPKVERGEGADNWGNFAAGVGTEVLLDPLTYLGGAGLLKSAAGQTVKALKLTPAIARGMSTAGSKVGNALARTTGTLGDALVRTAPSGARQLGMPLHRAKEVARHLRYGYSRGSEVAGQSLRSGREARQFGRRATQTTAQQAAGELGDLLPRAQRQAGPRLSQVLDEPVGAVTGGTLPFGLGSFDWKSVGPAVGKYFGKPELLNNLGRGRVAQAVAKGMDVVGDKIKYAAPTRLLRQNFDASTMGKYDKFEQQMAEVIHEGFAPAQADAALTQHWAAKEADDVLSRYRGEFGQAFEDAGQTPQAMMETFHDMIRNSMETGSNQTGFGQARTNLWDILQERTGRDTAGQLRAAPTSLARTGIINDMMAVGERIKRINDTIPHQINELGGSIKFMGDLQEGFAARHFPRHVKMEHAKLFGHRIAKTTSSSLLEGREAATRHIPTREIQQMIDDPALRTALAARRVRGQAHSPGVEFLLNHPRYSRHLTRVTDDAGQLLTPVQAARELGDFIGKRKQDARLYGADIFEDLLKYQRAGQIYKNALHGVHSHLGQNILPQSATGGVELRQVFTDAGMAEDIQKTLRAFRNSTGNKSMSLTDVADLRVAPEVADSVKALLAPQNMPEFMDQSLKMIDKFNGVFKNSVTVMAPWGIPLFMGFFGRNGISGQFNNLATAALNGPQGLLDYGKGFVESVQTIRRAHTLMKQLNQSSQTGFKMNLAQLMDRDPEMVLMIAHGVLGHKISFEGLENALLHGASPQNPWNLTQTMQEVLSASGPMPAKRFQDEIYNNLVTKGVSKPDALKRAKEAVETELIELLPGGRGIRAGFHHAATTGGKINQWVEYFNRAPLWHYFRKTKGYSPERAAHEVKLRQFDYSDLAPFEQQVMKRIIPFYTFSRKMSGLMAETLLEHPGGSMAQTIRATNRANSSDQGLVPDYVRETTSIPVSGPLAAILGNAPEGTKRFITGLGLGHEDPASFLSYNPSSPVGGIIRGGVLEGLSRVTPPLKALLEWGTGQTFFQRGPAGGRAISDLDPTVNRMIANISDSFSGEKTYRPKEYLSEGSEFILANSPISRVLSTGRQFSDPRKGLSAKFMNWATGLRVTDVSEAAQDAILREKAQDLMGDTGALTFKRTYYNKEQLDKMPPAQRQQAVLLQLLMNWLAQRSKSRKKERESAKAKPPGIGLGF